MRGDSTLALQEAIIAALARSSAVRRLVGERIFDEAPHGTPFPYVSLGPETAGPFEAQEVDGWDAFMQVDSWTETPGRVEVRRIMAAISGALHDAPLALRGHHLVMATLQFQTTVPEPGDVHMHGVQRFRFVTHI